MGGVFSVLSLDRVLLTSSLSSPVRSRPGLSWLPLMGFDFASLVDWCFYLLRPVVPLRLLASPHSGVCAMRVEVLPCFLTSFGTSWLGPSGLAIFASIPLVSRP